MGFVRGFEDPSKTTTRMSYPAQVQIELVFPANIKCVSLPHDLHVRIVIEFTKSRSTSICLQNKPKAHQTKLGTGHATIVFRCNDEPSNRKLNEHVPPQRLLPLGHVALPIARFQESEIRASRRRSGRRLGRDPLAHLPGIYCGSKEAS